jgi:hypothetical protein
LTHRGLRGLRSRLVAMRVEHIDLHLGKWLTRLHEITFLDYQVAEDSPERRREP